MFIVIPLFGEKGLEPDKIPQSKKEVEKILNTPNQSTFLDVYGYVSLNAKSWSSKDSIYEFELPKKEVVEPYYIAHRNVQLYDETYITWGFNKVTQILDMKAVGYTMKVLPDTFMIHLNHADIKGFTNWESGYMKDERHNLKIGTSVNRWQNLPGLLTNSYYPPWLKSEFLSTFSCINPINDQKLADLRNELSLFDDRVRSLKVILVMLIVVLIGFILIIIRESINFKY